MAAYQPKPSISSHRLFPAVVALWFATLFGLGFAVLPASALEKLVGASGIAAYIPAAAPPLGLTTRMILSLGAAIGGGLMGYAIARALAPRREREDREPRLKERPAPNRRPMPEGMRRPLSAMEDLGPPMIAPGPQPDEAGEVPAGMAIPEDEPEFPLQIDSPEPEVEEELAPQTTGEPDFETAPEAEFAAEPEPDAEPEFIAPLLQAQPTARALPSDPAADLARMGVVQLAERLGHAMRKSTGRPKSPPPAFLAELVGRPAAPPPPEPSVEAAPTPAFAPEPEMAVPAFAPSAEPVAPEAAVAPKLPEPLAAAERILARTSVATAGDSPAAPDAPRALAPELEAFGEEEYEYEESYLPSLSLPLAGLSPIDGPIEDEAIEDEEDWDSGEDGERYSSLLAIRLPEREPAPEADEFAHGTGADFGPETAWPAPPSTQAPEMPAPASDVRRFDAPPQAAAARTRPDRVETERVLRSALAAIQRMSGAA